MIWTVRRLVTLLAGCAVLACAVPAFAQITKGNVTQLPWAPRYDAAFDSQNGVYLLVAEGPPVRGQFVDGNGTPVGPMFTISLETAPGTENPYTAWSTVAFGGTAADPTFLVTYLAIEGAAVPKYGRLVRFKPGGAALVSDRTRIADDVKGEWYAADRSRSIWQGERFVVTTRRSVPGHPFSQAQLHHVDLTGQVTGGLLLGDGLDYQGGPSVACASSTLCMVTGFAAGVPFGGTGGIWARFFNPVTLLPLGAVFYLDDHSSPVDTPWVVYESHANRFLTAWYRRNGGRIDFRVTNADGTLGPLDKSRGFGGGAGEPGLMYNVKTRSSLLVSKHSDSADLVTVETGEDGFPKASVSPLLVTPWDGRVLEYRPAITASTTEPRWLVTYVLQAGGRAALVQGGTAEPSILSAAPQSLRFTGVNSAGVLSPVTPPQTIMVTDGSTTTRTSWTASASQPWVQLSQSAGTGSGILTIGVHNPGNVLAGQTSASASVTITPSGTSTVPVTVTVSLTLAPQAASWLPPLGSFDTPTNGATVSGTLAVTGWALDDVGIDRVEIWRDAIVNDPAPPFISTGHPANGKVFVAIATFVEGTRPDVALAYSGSPLQHRAGWGYLLLTRGFPNANGTFVLTAIAWDKEGKSTTLGQRTITVNNTTATKPFGTIDVPAYGATFSGNQFTFGWALTPNALCSMAGGQLFMTVDSAPPNRPITYGANRTDIAAAFPGLPDSNGAGGAVLLDSTQYTNGTHAIGWLVYDSCGNGDGVGSRFFTVMNAMSAGGAAADGGQSGPPDGPQGVVAGRGPAFPSVGRDAQSSRVAQAARGLWLVRGMGTRAAQVKTDATVWLSQTGRIELHTADPSAGDAPYGPSTSFEAYLELEGRLAALPIGSSFDSARGIFYWQPVAGFLGEFPLRIVQSQYGTPVAEWTAAIVVSPHTDETALHIDSPSANAVCAAGGGCVIQGWALDPEATDGSGIGAVHVWGTGANGTPRFLGAASLGGRRTDVGDSYGRQFDSAGYRLTMPPLDPGSYQVVVYAWSTRTGQWDAARVVTVTVR